MTQHHDSNARLEMLRETIDRNRENVPAEHEVEEANKQQEQAKA